MRLKTAIRLLKKGSKGENQLFFGLMRIYKNNHLVVSSGVGTAQRLNLYEPYLNDNVKNVLWHCHEHIWEFYL